MDTTISLNSLNVPNGSLSYFDYTPAGFYPSSVPRSVPFVFSDGSLTAYGQIGSSELIVAIADINTAPFAYVAAINGSILKNTFVALHTSATVSPVPLPDSLPLFGSAILALAFFGYSRRKHPFH